MPGEPLALDHQHLLDEALRQAYGDAGEATLSDPWFANLYLFRQAHDYRLCAGDAPCVAGLTYDGEVCLIPLFDITQACGDALAARLAAGGSFFPLGERQAALLRARPDAARFTLSACRDDADYLYAAASFRTYAGRPLAKKRNLLRQFLAACEVRSTRYGPHDQAAALSILEGWMRDKGRAGGEADHAACSEALRLQERFALQGFIHHVDGEPAGFVLAQCLSPGVYAMRFAKGLDRYKGLYPYMFQHFCQAMPDACWLNFEQDLGMPGFRRTKLSYGPVALLSKYRLALAVP